MDSAQNALQIANLYKAFDETIALDNVTFSIGRGAVCGLLGPNGAGKTTLLRIINHILSKDKGEVLVFGEEASFGTSQNIGYLPEERGLYENMRVEDQIYYFAELKGKKKSEIKPIMQEYLSLFDIENYRRRKIRELSKGNQQKVQIVASLAHDPELLIFDEPLSGFDPLNGILFQDLISKLKSAGKTIILSSHNMHSVEEICDSVVLINQGSVLVNDTISSLKKKYASGYYQITLDRPIDTERILQANLITDLKCISSGHEGCDYHFKKSDVSLSNNSILNLFSETSQILAFNQVIPSLNEIFIDSIKN